MSFRLCWEDFALGQVFEHGSRVLSEDDIVRFAREWDPQRYHTDPEAAKLTPFGGLVASGWQSCGVAMRLMCDAYLLETSCVGSPGIDEIRFLKPVRPGDALRFRATVLESVASHSRADRGTITFRWELLNQRDETVLSMLGKQIYLKRKSESEPDFR
jgi:acyl dehydratase